LGIILVWIGLFIIPSNTQARLDQFVDLNTFVEVDTSVQRNDQLNSFRQRLNNALSFLSSTDLRIRLESAHWQITDREYILLQALVIITGFAVGWSICSSSLGGMGLAILMYVLPCILLTRSAEVRRQKFANQVLDAPVLIRGAIQSGYGHLDSLDLVKQEV